MPQTTAGNSAGSTRERALWWAARRYNSESLIQRWHPAPGTGDLPSNDSWPQIIDEDLGRPHINAAARYMRRRKLVLADEHRELLARLPDCWRLMLGLPGQSVEALAVRLGLEMVAVSVCAVGRGKALRSVLSVIEGREADLLVTRVSELEGQQPAKPLTDHWPERVKRTGGRLKGTKLLRVLGLTQLAALIHEQVNPADQVIAARHARSELITVLRAASGNTALGQGEAQATEPVLKQLLGQISGGGQ